MLYLFIYIIVCINICTDVCIQLNDTGSHQVSFSMALHHVFECVCMCMVLCVCVNALKSNIKH